MFSYGILLLIAVAVNLGDRRMLLLALIIGLDVFIPIPNTHFYLWCVFVELVVGFTAYFVQADASDFVIRVTIILIGLHFLGWLLNGYPPASPYHLLVKICEHFELLACAALTILKRLDHARFY